MNYFYALTPVQLRRLISNIVTVFFKKQGYYFFQFIILQLLNLIYLFDQPNQHSQKSTKDTEFKTKTINCVGCVEKVNKLQCNTQQRILYVSPLLFKYNVLVQRYRKIFFFYKKITLYCRLEEKNQHRKIIILNHFVALIKFSLIIMCLNSL